MIDWIWFPTSSKPRDLARKVVEAFEAVESSITSDSKKLASNRVLSSIEPQLKILGFSVESGKKKDQKIPVPVLYGLQGKAHKSFHVDAYHEGEGFVIEVEAGRATYNNQFLKDLFEACMMDGVKYLCIAVRRTYAKRNDFEEVEKHFEALYASNRLKLPLEGILIVGY